MAEENQERNARQAEGQEETEAPLVVAATPDASNYVVQPTSYRIPPQMQVKGDMPDNRFTEEVLKGSDEDTGEGWESHPEENQPVPGIGPDASRDDLPDTTGRAALQAEKRDR